MKNSAAKLWLKAQARKKRDQSKKLSDKTSLYIDANATLLHLSAPTAT